MSTPSIERIDERVNQHETRLDGHDTRIEKVECRVGTIETLASASNKRIDHLCEKLDGLITTLRWAIGIALVSMLGFGVWMLQQMILK